jgi:hypothetical protein
MIPCARDGAPGTKFPGNIQNLFAVSGTALARVNHVAHMKLYALK